MVESYFRVYLVLEIRPAIDDDLPRLRSIYADAVACLGPSVYTPAQVTAWKAFAAEAAFARFVSGVASYVAQLEGNVVGFCGIARSGHVASIYVAPQWNRRGIGQSLLEHALRHHPAPTSRRYFAEASVFSLPLFERCGFRRVASEFVDRNGVTFERHLVERAADSEYKAEG